MAILGSPTPSQMKCPAVCETKCGIKEEHHVALTSGKLFLLPWPLAVVLPAVRIVCGENGGSEGEGTGAAAAAATAAASASDSECGSASASAFASRDSRSSVAPVVSAALSDAITGGVACTAASSGRMNSAALSSFGAAISAASSVLVVGEVMVDGERGVDS